MKVVYKYRAAKVIEKAAEWVEQRNTPGSGERWFARLDETIHALANSKAKLALCKHPSLAKFNYRCYTYNNWIIAFRVSKNMFEVCRFIWGKRLA